MATTKARRGKGASKKTTAKGKTGGKNKAAKSAKSNGGEKLSIADKRLSHASLSDRRKAVKMAQAGDGIAEVAEFLGISSVKAKFLVMQQQVADGKVPKIKPENEGAIVKALKSGDDFSSVAWVACRTGLSGGKVTQIAKDNNVSFDRGRPSADEAAPKKKGSTRKSTKGKTESSSKARRGKSARGKSTAKGKKSKSRRGKAVNPNA